ncbi:metallopeptidase TldD-related protein [Sphaerisporangium sp. B11E5]|uniref:metallopeptidase TldD-related protein n=1 Tax=Sphaerisporangium sp. B11E5 TaxID=3153563 RepID=UPI00325E9BA7
MSTLADRLDQVGAAAAARAAHWEILVVERDDTVVEVGSGVPDLVRSAHETALCLRVHRDGRVGTATTTCLDDVDALVGDAVRNAAHGPPASPGRATGRNATPEAAPASAADQGTRSVRLLAEELGALQRAAGLTVHGTVTRTEQAVHRAAPDGRTTTWDRFFHIAALAEGAAVQLPWTGWTRTPVLPAALPAWLEAAAGWDGLPAADAPSGDHDVLLAPSAVHTLLTPLVTALNGTAVTAGRSFVAGHLGAPFLHPSIGLDDHPSVRAAQDEEGTGGLAWPGSDDDGVPCAPLTLVERGVPVRAYHSVRTAAACGTAPTGHGFRGNALRRTVLKPATPVLNGATLSAEPADVGTFDELLAGVREGVLVESLMGGHQRAGLSPVVEGRLRLGFLVRDGRVAGILRQRPVALDLREVLGRRFRAVSDRRWAVSRIWSGRMPFVLAGGA